MNQLYHSIERLRNSNRALEFALATLTLAAVAGWAVLGGIISALGALFTGALTSFLGWMVVVVITPVSCWILWAIVIVWLLENSHPR